MAILEYGIGGNEIKADTSESMADIPENRSLIIEQLTSDEPISPEVVTGLSTIEDVFAHYSPNVDIEFTNEDGQQVQENFKFNSVADFSVRSMTESSDFLGDLNMQKNFYENLIKQLRSSKVLQKALSDVESKEALVAALTQLKSELVQK